MSKYRNPFSQWNDVIIRFAENTADLQAVVDLNAPFYGAIKGLTPNKVPLAVF
jgi:hypothetical protein